MKITIISLLLLTLLSGCISQNNNSVKAPIAHKQTEQNVTKPALPKIQNVTKPALLKAPKKHIKLKKVDDNNFNDKYMYPEDRVKKETAEQPKVTKPTAVNPDISQPTLEMSTEKVPTTEQPAIPTPVSTTSVMTKAECIAMISQEKFDKYSQMFGNENASIKRCIMLKAMNR